MQLKDAKWMKYAIAKNTQIGCFFWNYESSTPNAPIVTSGINASEEWNAFGMRTNCDSIFVHSFSDVFVWIWQRMLRWQCRHLATLGHDVTCDTAVCHTWHATPIVTLGECNARQLIIVRTHAATDSRIYFHQNKYILYPMHASRPEMHIYRRFYSREQSQMCSHVRFVWISLAR